MQSIGAKLVHTLRITLFACFLLLAFVAPTKATITMEEPMQESTLSNSEISTAPLRSEESASSMKMRSNDPNGYAMTIMSMSVVFVGLFVLFLCFKFISKAVIAIEQTHEKRKKNASVHAIVGSGKPNIDNEIAVAIALALESDLLTGDPHEPKQLTFGSIERKYSPWNSKFLSMRTTPKRPNK